MLVDEVEITVKGGDGGAGIVAWAKPPLRGPSGGSGGRGEDIYTRAVNDLMLLRQFVVKKTVTAESGKRGQINQRTGRDGEDMELVLPTGSVINDIDTGESWELNHAGEKIKLCVGGNGGRGNYALRSAILTTPKVAKPGGRGQERKIRIVLKLVADFGLIGLPNAGKSSLLNELTAAKAPVAQYPFTTLSPNLGALNKKIIADIPGLIEGASKGRGLGIKFLKHIEKIGHLLHCVAADSEDIIKNYKTVRQELEEYSPELIKKPEIVLLTKSDLADEKKLKLQMAKLKIKALPVSIYDWESIEALKTKLIQTREKGGNE
jgi:GTPase